MSLTLMRFSADFLTYSSMKQVDNTFDTNISLLMKTSDHTSSCLGGIYVSISLLWEKAKNLFILYCYLGTSFSEVTDFPSYRSSEQT